MTSAEMKDREFDDIRPYYDEEIPDAMARIAAHSLFPALCSYVFPDRETGAVRRLILSVRTVKDFQSSVMWNANKEIIRRSMTGLTFSGLENIDRNSGHLYISNHRDIMLDASLMNLIIYDNGFDSCEITFGANLMEDPLVVDIGKSNKMFRVERGGTPKDFYKNSVHLSRYIRHTIKDNGQSVWIAQRNGRTKDGNDRTDQGIINMFRMSCPEDRVKAITELGVIPVSVSYEWEPCDMLKAVELYRSGKHHYTKKPGEDINSILTGITQPKGRVHISFCRPLSEEEIRSCSDRHNNVSNRNIADLIDYRILGGYRLYPNNYIAADINDGSNRRENLYKREEKEAFTERIGLLREVSRTQMIPEDDFHILKSIFIGIYANPVYNSYKSKNDQQL